jgi:hypothetical protein
MPSTMSITPPFLTNASFSNNGGNGIQPPKTYAEAVAFEEQRKQNQNNANWALAGTGATATALTLMGGSEVAYQWGLANQRKFAGDVTLSDNIRSSVEHKTRSKKEMIDYLKSIQAEELSTPENTATFEKLKADVQQIVPEAETAKEALQKLEKMKPADLKPVQIGKKLSDAQGLQKRFIDSFTEPTRLKEMESQLAAYKKYPHSNPLPYLEATFEADLNARKHYNKKLAGHKQAMKKYQTKKTALLNLQLEHDAIKAPTQELSMDKHKKFKQAVEVGIAEESELLKSAKNKSLSEIDKVGSVWTNNAKELEAQGLKDLASHTKKARLTGSIMAGAMALLTIGGTIASVVKGNETEKTMKAKLAEMRNAESKASDF